MRTDHRGHYDSAFSDFLTPNYYKCKHNMLTCRPSYSFTFERRHLQVPFRSAFHPIKAQSSSFCTSESSDWKLQWDDPNYPSLRNYYARNVRQNVLTATEKH
ncbi:Hypothetical protein NTJ_15793 [Nesidiocoris tenuis]|uniref:Uncharacterized protein n=1 Tax=Nesidiocoris tenuis TaxID=355587 RepID=A0ABN7BGW1_9HEMI|nr:Hypothetical protein NTJ_15793 [Nesidiocoris tenuis]